MQHISIKPTFSPLIIPPTHKLFSKTQLKNPIISSKWPKKRSGSKKSHKLIFNSMAYIASTLNIFPEPWDSLFKQFLVAGGGGNGGKNRFNSQFNGGGGGKGRKFKLGFWVILLISSSLSIWVVLEREKGCVDLGLWVLLVNVCVFGVYLLVVKGWRREIKDWVLGFCCGGVIMGLSLRNYHVFLRCVDVFLGNSSRYFVSSKKRRNGKRWVWRI